ncbi:MAG TPA: hypothetical protein VGK17_24555 [Propionicimonas sp.]|jgi:hypothetical protein
MSHVATGEMTFRPAKSLMRRALSWMQTKLKMGMICDHNRESATHETPRPDARSLFVREYRTSPNVPKVIPTKNRIPTRP